MQSNQFSADGGPGRPLDTHGMQSAILMRHSLGERQLRLFWWEAVMDTFCR